MYGKIFEVIFDSSLSTQGDFITTYVFMSMIVLADEHGFVDYSKEALFERLKFPDDFVCGEAYRNAITILEAPDKNSNLEYEDGRRIIPMSRLDGIEGNRGWLIVNYLYYRDRSNTEEQKQSRREYMRNYMSARRKNNKKNKELNDCKHSVNTRKQKFPYTDTDTDTDTIPLNPPFVLPANINKTAWQEFEQNRKDIRKPLTNLARKKNAAVLAGLTDEEQKTIVDNSIVGSWAGLFPLKKGQANGRVDNSAPARIRRAADKARAAEAAAGGDAEILDPDG